MISAKKGRSQYGPNDMKQEACDGDESSPFLKTRYSAYQHRQVPQEDGREWLNGCSRRYSGIGMRSPECVLLPDSVEQVGF